jgi:vacuolar-type H+-ATPase subunit E/Vma4
MTPPADEVLTEALAPVRAAVLAAARRDRDQRLAQARAEAAVALGAAGSRAEEIVAAARDAGRADAEAGYATEQSRARRTARARTLRARREAYEQLRRQSRKAVLRVRDEPGYPAVRAALTAAVHRLLGPDAEIVEAQGGGVVGRSGARRVDLSLIAFADRAVDPVVAGTDRP